ncbi:MAG: hypothetical protein JRI86_15215, partial [Deltaproteobacteria bacterium]|nr:hypothetical protein [Deltaproteobacteria bacterium]
EDGTYWDDPDDWDDYEYDNEPDYVSEDQNEELLSFFDESENLFLNDRLEDARIVYDALFRLINYIKEVSYYSPPHELDIREVRARYCRCVFETSEKSVRLDDFINVMEIDVFSAHNENEYDENYPLLQDVIDSRPGEMEDMESFLPVWKRALNKRGTKGRPAVLFLEAISRLEGIKGVSELARKWKNNQPQGYLFWLRMLKSENDQKGIVDVSIEGLKAIRPGRFRERIAEFLIEAASELNEKEYLLLGKRERFFSFICDQNLLDLLDEAVTQDARKNELKALIDFFKGHKAIDTDEKTLYVKVLLMAGKLHDAFAVAKNEKSLGWSFHSNAGVVFGSVMSVLSGHSEMAGTIQGFLGGYANARSVYSQRFAVDDRNGTSFYIEIIKGLKQIKITKLRTSEYLSWAEKIGKNRIENIVSKKYRKAYERAAKVLGSLAEAHIAMGKKDKALKILNKYYNEKYNRFSAFRREVRTVVKDSHLLTNSGFLN